MGFTHPTILWRRDLTIPQIRRMGETHHTGGWLKDERRSKYAFCRMGIVHAVFDGDCGRRTCAGIPRQAHPHYRRSRPRYRCAHVWPKVHRGVGVPNQLVYSSSGNGTPPHLAGEMFKTMAKVDILHVPYKFATPALVDVVSGQVQIMWPIMSIALPQVQAGKLRGLAVSSRERTRLAPQLPTIAESALPGYEIIGWNGLIAPANTPRAVVNKLNAEIQRNLKSSELVQRLAQSSYDPAGDKNSPEQFTEFVRAEISKFAKLVKESGAKVD